VKSSVAVSSCNTGKISVGQCDKIMNFLKTRKENIEINETDGLGMEFNSLPSRADARGSADIIYHM